MTTKPDLVCDKNAMIAGMTPVLTEGSYVYCTTDDAKLAAELIEHGIAFFREEEGFTLVLPKAKAAEHGFPVNLPMARIVLTVFSALDGVGLTAAVATALGEEDISCNMIAAYHHDHVFVPEARRHDALRILKEAQRRATTDGPEASK